MILHPHARSRRLGIGGLFAPDRWATALGRHLDDEFHWFRHVAPGGMLPIDAVLVGPSGTWTLTMAGERGRYTRRNTGHWYRFNRSTESWVPWDAAPITAARLAARRLSLYLERAALPDAVSAVLAPPHDMSVELPRGEHIGLVVAAQPERLAPLVAAGEVLTSSQVDRIVALLDPRQPLPQLAQAAPGG